jgi:hypothetical protein
MGIVQHASLWQVEAAEERNFCTPEHLVQLLHARTTGAGE